MMLGYIGYLCWYTIYTLRLYHRWNIYLFLGSFLWLTTVECRLLYILIHYMIYYAAFI